MNAALLRLAERIDSLSEATGRVIGWLTLAMVVTTFVIVVLRYLFNVGWISLQESVTWMHALVFSLGAAFALRRDGHVRVDIFYARMGPRGKAWVNLLGTLFLLLPTCAFILWVSWDYVATSWSLRESSAEAGGLPAIFLLKTAIVLMMVLLLLQGLALAIRSLLVLRQSVHPGAHEETE
jgi:TRAP-type mannitol/chloroaromatic compound transport system permease small subunit